MAFRLYSGNGVWLLVPDCMEASRAANARHGPLQFEGAVDPEVLTHGELADIESQFDAQAFAIIEAALAEQLLRSG